VVCSQGGEQRLGSAERNLRSDHDVSDHFEFGEPAFHGESHAEEFAMNTGYICDWNFNDEIGRIIACSGVSGCFPFEWDSCSNDLKTNLAQHGIIHASGPCPGPRYAIRVNFDLDLTGAAINIDLA
jgi:hypothetical protein